MAITTTDASLLRLLQLTSANLPVGAYAFSQGLEYAIESQWLTSADDVEEWLDAQLHHGLARLDIPLLLRQHHALEMGDRDALWYWNDLALACRESREMRLTDTATGEALLRLFPSLDIPFPEQPAPCSFVTAFARAAHHWTIAPDLSGTGFLWSWLENQVVAATKLLPLGQSRAQQLLARLQTGIPGALASAADCPDQDLGACLPGLAIASMRHETQYSRLFRS